MDKTITSLLAAVGALVAAAPAQSAPLPPSPETVLHASSYADLLRPVPNAVATLQALDDAAPASDVELVQFGPIVREFVGHHHHHHRYYRRRYHHHHHHHHHHGYYR